MAFLTFPPHCSHKLQPLDVGVFGPFKAFCKESFNTWMNDNPGKTISIYNIAKLTLHPYERAFVKSNITSAFRKTSMWPKNRSIFNDDDYLPSFVTDRPASSTVIDNRPDMQDQMLGHEVGPQASTSQASSSFGPNLEPSVGLNTPAKISVADQLVDNDRSEPPSNKDLKISTPESVRPFPKAAVRSQAQVNPEEESQENLKFLPRLQRKIGWSKKTWSN